MKLREFINEMQEVADSLNYDPIVLMSSDGEGNKKSPYYNSDWLNVACVAESSWEYSTGLLEFTEELQEKGYEEEDVVEGEPCIVLYPIN